MDIEAKIQYKDNNEDIIGAEVLIYNDTGNIVKKIVIVEEQQLQALQDRLDGLDTAYLTEEDLITILANTAENTVINATHLNNMNSGDFALREHTHNDYAAKNHASVANQYGLGGTGQYGHVKTRNDLNASSFISGESLSAYQGAILGNRVSALESNIDELSDEYYKNSMRIKIGRWSDSQGENGTKIELIYKSDGIYAKLYCDKPDFNYSNKDIILVLNGIPYTRTTDSTGKTERLAINLERGTYILTAFIRSYEGVYPASDMKIIKVS